MLADRPGLVLHYCVPLAPPVLELCHNRLHCLRYERQSCLIQDEHEARGYFSCEKSIDELKAFVASSDVMTFKGNSREETYAWIERTLRTYSYFSRPD